MHNSRKPNLTYCLSYTMECVANDFLTDFQVGKWHSYLDSYCLLNKTTSMFIIPAGEPGSVVVRLCVLIDLTLIFQCTIVYMLPVS